MSVGEARPASERPVILHIEDNVSNRKLVELVVGRRPAFSLLEAEDGETGLELAQTISPALVLLDLRLPGISGEEVLERLRADPATAGLRIVVISAEARPGETTRLLQAGADSFLVKPLNIQDLLDLLDAIEAER